jgi:hypothetical protein
MLRRSLLVAAMVLAPAGLTAGPASLAAASAPAGHAPASCSGVIQITQLAFTPAAVAPGQIGTLHLTARNCTGTSQQTSALWLGSFAGPGGGIPPGCPAIDPLLLPANFAPHGHLRSSGGYLVPAGCAASQLQVTVEFEQGGTVLAARTADLTIIAAPATAG